MEPFVNAKATKSASKKKTAESASKATTPTKESQDEKDEAEVKKPAKRQKTTEEASPKSPKAKEDDNGKPKKPPTGYFLFTSDKREARKAENPSLSMTDLAKLLGAEWKEMSDEDKAPYCEQAAKLKAEYEEKYGLSEAEKKRAAKADKPKGPRTSYFIWLAEHREKLKEEFPTLSPKELTSKAGERWRELSDEEKAAYNERAKQEKFKEGKEPESAGTKRKADDGEDESSQVKEDKTEEKEAAVEEKATKGQVAGQDDKVEGDDDKKEELKEGEETGEDEKKTADAEKPVASSGMDTEETGAVDDAAEEEATEGKEEVTTEEKSAEEDADDEEKTDSAEGEAGDKMEVEGAEATEPTDADAKAADE